MKKVFEIEFLQTGQTTKVEEKNLDVYQDYYITKEIKQCDQCGEKTSALNVIGKQAKCTSCSKGHKEIK